VQVQRISGKPRTKLDALLSLFEQSDFEDDDETAKFYTYRLKDPDVEQMAKMLAYMCADPKLRAQLEAEAEEDRTRNEWLRNQKRRDAEEAAKWKQAAEAKDVELAEKDLALAAQAAKIAELERQLSKNNRR
jgi:roadblock/LC7 domain-containing protein